MLFKEIIIWLQKQLNCLVVTVDPDEYSDMSYGLYLTYDNTDTNFGHSCSVKFAGKSIEFHNLSLARCLSYLYYSFWAFHITYDDAIYDFMVFLEKVGFDSNHTPLNNNKKLETFINKFV